MADLKSVADKLGTFWGDAGVWVAVHPKTTMVAALTALVVAGWLGHII